MADHSNRKSDSVKCLAKHISEIALEMNAMPRSAVIRGRQRARGIDQQPNPTRRGRVVPRCSTRRCLEFADVRLACCADRQSPFACVRGGACNKYSDELCECTYSTIHSTHTHSYMHIYSTSLSYSPSSKGHGQIVLEVEADCPEHRLLPPLPQGLCRLLSPVEPCRDPSRSQRCALVASATTTTRALPSPAAACVHL